MKELVVFKGRIGEIVHLTQPDGRVFEQYRRPPGTRIIIINSDREVLLIKEFRHENSGYDLRLPGGKVCDTIEEYDTLRKNKQDIFEAALIGAIKEAREETGLEIIDPKLITVSKAGSTVEWDLYYYLVKKFNTLETGQQLETGEDISTIWMKPAQIRDAVQNSEMKEWRSVGVLLGLILPQLEK